MKIETHAAAGTDIDSVRQLLSPLTEHTPDFLVVSCSSEFDLLALNAALSDLSAKALHGTTSCLGVMTNEGMAGREGNGIGYFALWDEDGAFGSAGVGFDQTENHAASMAARKATQLALSRAGRPGEAPDLIWVSASPGQEEEIIQGIEAVIGGGIPIVGGSAADNTVSGGWAIFGEDGIHTSGVQISVLFPSKSVAAEFQSGYAPSGKTAKVTRAEGRRLYELDGRPAGDVYQELSGLKFEASGDGTPTAILSQTSFDPLGVEIGGVANIPYYLLMHAAALNSDGSIDLFANVAEGTELHAMSGSTQSLTQRAGRVAAQTRRQADTTGAPVAGALMIYCGGCMLSVTDHMDRVVSGVNESLDGAPFLGLFTFGEQGHVLDQKNSHGNLMISCVTFFA
ncbi:MAG: FIST N-terminal domain-containing protein [Pseudomonadota bacterium]